MSDTSEGIKLLAAIETGSRLQRNAWLRCERKAAMTKVKNTDARTLAFIFGLLGFLAISAVVPAAMTTHNTAQEISTMQLTRKDFQNLQTSISGELLNYLGHAATGGLRAGRETDRLEYLKGLSDRLKAAEASASE